MVINDAYTIKSRRKRRKVQTVRITIMRTIIMMITITIIINVEKPFNLKLYVFNIVNVCIILFESIYIDIQMYVPTEQT